MAVETNADTTGAQTENTDDESTMATIKEYAEWLLLTPFAALASVTVAAYGRSYTAGRVTANIVQTAFALVVAAAVQRFVYYSIISILQWRGKKMTQGSFNLVNTVAWAILTTIILSVLVTVYQKETEALLNEIRDDKADSVQVSLIDSL